MSQIDQFILIVLAFVVFYVNGVEYHVSIGDDCTNYNLNSNDTCIIHCDTKRQKNLIFNCGTGKCVFNCEQPKCFEKGVLYASDSKDLNVLSTGKECLKTATISLPNYGNALFSMNEAKSFKEITINAGTNTNNIIIDCTFGHFGEGDECKHITVNAQTAQFLQIIIGANSELQGTNTQNAIVNCPQNADRNSSCVFDVLDGGIVSFVTINTLYGIPADLLINIGMNVLLNDINILCMNGVSNIFGNNLFNYGDCWNTIPTYSPTIIPTKYPTAIPTKSPTNYPTVSPTNQLTVVPSVSPIVEITSKPTNLPIFTIDTTVSVLNTKDMTVIESTDLNMMKSIENNAKKGTVISIADLCMFIGGGIFIICFCCIGLLIRKRWKRENYTNNVIHYQVKSNSSNHVVTIAMSPKSNSNTHTRISTNEVFDVDLKSCASLEDNMPMEGENNDTNDTDEYYESSGTEI